MILLDGGHALVRCNHCKNPVQARHSRHHLQECRPYQRRQKLGRMSFERDGKKLYAIAAARFDGNEWRPEMHYAHGYDARHAKRAFLFGERDHSKITILDVGLAIGMFAADRDGKLLVAD